MLWHILVLLPKEVISVDVINRDTAGAGGTAGARLSSQCCVIVVAKRTRGNLFGIASRLGRQLLVIIQRSIGTACLV